jgi:zinc D-Ala-D-Ala dipeptidase
MTEKNISELLQRPIPDLTTLREQKKGYENVPIDTSSSLFAEPLVDISSFGIAGQAYYSRPNATTKVAIQEVPKTLFLRKSIVQTLSQLNSALEQPEITQFFRGSVELYVEDALRPIALQSQLHDVLIPRLLREQYPGITPEEIEQRIKDIIAIPSSDPRHPSPHTTGGAFDITLRYKQVRRLFVAGSAIEMGHLDGEMGKRINPDYFEHIVIRTKADLQAQRNRRAFYAIMTGTAFNIPTGFMNNPTEWWHWGRGDQLSARISGDSSAYYSLAMLK